jgi:hypothetical protein
MWGRGTQRTLAGCNRLHALHRAFAVVLAWRRRASGSTMLLASPTFALAV